MKVQPEKIFNIPGVILALVIAFIAIHLWREWLGAAGSLDVLAKFAFVPGRFTFVFAPETVSAAFRKLLEGNDYQAQVARFFMGDGTAQWWTLLTYAFLHGDWSHLGVNSLWLAAFGSAVARRFGTTRFLAFFAFTALAGAGAHYVTHLSDLQPVIGASAAVSGAMAAAIRFVFQPGAPLGESLGFSGHHDYAYRLPALPLRQVFSDRRALSFLAFWFLSNLLFGVAALPLGLSDATIAWEAHIGGFVAGLIAFSWFDPKTLAYDHYERHVA